jgi:hypothetical protein
MVNINGFYRYIITLINTNIFHYRVDIITKSTLFRQRLDGNLNHTTQQLKNRIIVIKYYLLEPSLLDTSLILAV